MFYLLDESAEKSAQYLPTNELVKQLISSMRLVNTEMLVRGWANGRLDLYDHHHVVNVLTPGEVRWMLDFAVALRDELNFRRQKVAHYVNGALNTIISAFDPYYIASTGADYPWPEMRGAEAMRPGSRITGSVAVFHAGTRMCFWTKPDFGEREDPPCLVREAGGEYTLGEPLPAPPAATVNE